MENSRTTVLACVDGSTWQDAVVDYAAWVAGTVRAPLKFLHNIEEREAVPTDLSGSIGLGAREELLEELISLENQRSKILMEQGKLMLEDAHRRAATAGATDILKVQRHGGLLESLIDLEQEIRVLVIGARGQDHGTSQKLGTHLEAAIRALHRPILVVNKGFSDTPRRCMLAYDGSEPANMALDMMAISPLFATLECHLVHVSKEAESPVLQAPAARLEKASLSVTTANLHGDVEQQLLDYQQAHNIDLTVMGAFGHSRIHELLFGSITHKMLLQSKVPLLLLR